MPVGDTVLGLSSRATHSHVENLIDLAAGARLLRLKGINPNASSHYVYCFARLAASGVKTLVAQWAFILGGAVVHTAPFNAAGISTNILCGEKAYAMAASAGGGTTRFGVAPLTNFTNSHASSIGDFQKIGFVRWADNLISPSIALTGAQPILPFRWDIRCEEIQLVVSSCNLDTTVPQWIGVAVMSE